MSFAVTLNDPQPGFQDNVTFKRHLSENSAFYIVQLQIIYLLNLQCNVLLMHGPLVIVVPLVTSSSLVSSNEDLITLSHQ